MTAPHKPGDFLFHLPVIPCHRLPERSLHCCNKQFPVCARCTGILVGYLAIPVFFFLHIPLIWGVLMSLPLLVDGFTQRWGWRTSTNRLRLITGLLSGVGQASIIVNASIWLTGIII